MAKDFEHQTDYIIFTFPYQTNGNHALEPLTDGDVISERHWKSTFDFTETVNNYGLKRGTVRQIVRFIFQIQLNYTYNLENLFTACS